MTINLFGRDAVFGLGDEPIDEDADKLDIPIHAFDLIVADECHRGYSSKELSVWRTTLDHFDAIKLGLTATPAAHTTAYFENIVYRYEYERAVREGYLVDYDVVSINSNVRMNGVFLEEGEQVEAIDPMSGVKQLDLIEDERSFDTTKIEREITAPDSKPSDPRGGQDPRGRRIKEAIGAASRRSSSSRTTTSPIRHTPTSSSRLPATSSAKATPSSQRSPAESTDHFSASGVPQRPNPSWSCRSTCSPQASTSPTSSSSSFCGR